MNNLNNTDSIDYQLKVEKYFKDGWSLLNKEMGPFIGMTFLYFLINLTLSYIPFLNVFTNLITSALSGGFYIYCRNIKRQKQTAKDFFAGFYYLKDIFLYFLALLLLVVPVVVLFFLLATPSTDFFQALVQTSQSNDPAAAMRLSESFSNVGPSFFIGFFILMIYLIYLTTSYLFVIPLIVDAELSFWNAMELSRKTVGKHFFRIFFAVLVLGILAAIGTIVSCAVGLLLIFPLIICITFEAYDQIFQPHADEYVDDIEQFGQIDDDINTESQEREKE
ncbi:MAG: hypothetical protein RIC95_04530 [Vicingaceae bacterium]